MLGKAKQKIEKIEEVIKRKLIKMETEKNSWVMIQIRLFEYVSVSPKFKEQIFKQLILG